MSRLNLARLRKSAGMSQRELADLLQVRQSFLSLIENGKSRLPEDKELRIKEIFRDYNLDNFYEDDDDVLIGRLPQGVNEADVIAQLLHHFHDLAHRQSSAAADDSEKISILRDRNDLLSDRNDLLSARIDELRDEVDRLRRENLHLRGLLLENGIDPAQPI